MEYVERIEIENNIITKHIIGEKPKKEKEGVTYIYGSNIQANIGDDIRMYEDLIAGKKKSLKTLIAENLIQIPEGKKLMKKLKVIMSLKKQKESFTMKANSQKKIITLTSTSSGKQLIQEKPIRWVCRF